MTPLTLHDFIMPLAYCQRFSVRLKSGQRLPVTHLRALAARLQTPAVADKKHQQRQNHLNLQRQNLTLCWFAWWSPALTATPTNDNKKLASTAIANNVIAALFANAPIRTSRDASSCLQLVHLLSIVFHKFSEL